jgi:hypothetical protein
VYSNGVYIVHVFSKSVFCYFAYFVVLDAIYCKCKYIVANLIARQTCHPTDLALCNLCAHHIEVSSKKLYTLMASVFCVACQHFVSRTVAEKVGFPTFRHTFLLPSSGECLGGLGDWSNKRFVSNFYVVMLSAD